MSRWAFPNDPLGLRLGTSPTSALRFLTQESCGVRPRRACICLDGEPKVNADYCCQPVPLMVRGSKNRQPSGHPNGASSFTSTRHRCTTSSPARRLE